MKAQRQSSDRISNLPQDIIEKILTFMPIRDALKTSILSKKWRHCWKGMPKLVFDDRLSNVSSDMEDVKKYKLVITIFHVLLLHRGPILELCICISDEEIFNEIDQIILHLSWSKNIKKFIFEVYQFDEYYKLPSSFFSLQGLEHLFLKYCIIELPSTFNEFSMLKSLKFYEVYITATMLKRFLISCPLLEEFTWVNKIGYDCLDFTGGNKCTFVELFTCLPSAQVVNISWFENKDFYAGVMSQKLPTSLVYLRILVLQVCFHEQDQISSTLCVINSSPNLEKINLRMIRYVAQTCTTLLDPQDYFGLKLDHLKELVITSFHNYASEMEFVKLIMGKSPLLKKTRIKLSTSVSVEEEVKMLRDLVYLQFPRASPEAKLIIERPKTLPAKAVKF
ncbi:F-box/FBD/LRR-repeat protein At1g13570 [Lactuca sativa]|uniref:F-box/FBD/LRR-repeat protein At1g13570 n=1 Tax=Lactuca sativa TaxID=4236 RepID=UPI0022AF4475|nr:F-box/FBD/LRR-repeat protein At1g13570 [Lactuca sativa]